MSFFFCLGKCDYNRKDNLVYIENVLTSVELALSSDALSGKKKIYVGYIYYLCVVAWILLVNYYTLLNRLFDKLLEKLYRIILEPTTKY